MIKSMLHDKSCYKIPGTQLLHLIQRISRSYYTITIITWWTNAYFLMY